MSACGINNRQVLFETYFVVCVTQTSQMNNIPNFYGRKWCVRDLVCIFLVLQIVLSGFFSVEKKKFWYVIKYRLFARQG